MNKIAEVTIKNMDAKIFDALGFTVPPGALDDNKRAILLPPSIFFRMDSYKDDEPRYYIAAEKLPIAEEITGVKQVVAVREDNFLKKINREQLSDVFDYKIFFDVEDKATRDGGFVIDFIHALTVDIDHPDADYAATLLVYKEPHLMADVFFVGEDNKIYTNRYLWREYDHDTLSADL